VTGNFPSPSYCHSPRLSPFYRHPALRSPIRRRPCLAATRRTFGWPCRRGYPRTTLSASPPRRSLPRRKPAASPPPPPRRPPPTPPRSSVYSCCTRSSSSRPPCALSPLWPTRSRFPRPSRCSRPPPSSSSTSPPRPGRPTSLTTRSRGSPLSSAWPSSLRSLCSSGLWPSASSPPRASSS
jgi:hypothetical protein